MICDAETCPESAAEAKSFPEIPCGGRAGRNLKQTNKGFIPHWQEQQD